MVNKKQLKAYGKGEFIYDYKHDILTFRIKDRNYKMSIEAQNLIADIDDKGFVTGMRIFDATKVFGVNKQILRNIVNGEFQATIENNTISIVLKFVGKLRNRDVSVTEKQNFVQQITRPAGSTRLMDSSVICPVEA